MFLTDRIKSEVCYQSHVAPALTGLWLVEFATLCQQLKSWCWQWHQYILGISGNWNREGVHIALVYTYIPLSAIQQLQLFLIQVFFFVWNSCRQQHSSRMCNRRTGGLYLLTREMVLLLLEPQSLWVNLLLHIILHIIYPSPVLCEYWFDYWYQHTSDVNVFTA